jgi:uncharacterized protein
MPLPLPAARALHLHAQCLARRPRRRPRKADVLEAIRRMGALQIDTISVVARSPYLALWSRLGTYEPRWLDELLAEGRLFEYWAHEASFLPIEDFALYRHRMLDRHWAKWRYAHTLMERHPEAVERVLARIRDHGPVRSADFERAAPGGTWWDWKPEKRILESLFTAGELMIARREGFQRVYDLRERVLPGWNDAERPDPDAVRRALTLSAVRALGIARPAWIPDYFRMAKPATRAAAHSLAEEGALLRVEVEGWKEPALVHPDHTEALHDASEGRLRATHTALLSPFDPVVWDRRRAAELFGFEYRIEVYTPAAKRVHGYYVLPILHRGRLVGRLDAKAHRRAGVFEVKALYLEPGVRATARLAADLARTLAECAAWHRTPRVELRDTDPPAFGAHLHAALHTAAERPLRSPPGDGDTR